MTNKNVRHSEEFVYVNAYAWTGVEIPGRIAIPYGEFWDKAIIFTSFGMSWLCIKHIFEPEVVG